MAVKETFAQAEARRARLQMVADAYPNFVDFLHDGMEFLGFSTTVIQAEIGEFLQYGPENIMVQAQRSQAKTTITALYAVWSLVHAPLTRVLVISAGGTQANEISTLIVRVILNWDILECMRPDRNNGDRVSVEHFDLHYSIRGLVDKSPSVACVGITANLQGKRADLLIADDVESRKNSLTATMREQLLNTTKDFVSIVQSGRIIWLGTPQTQDSIYNTLPGRGVTVRIWPGRYPTPKQMGDYGNMLAPSIAKAIQHNPSLQTGGGLDGQQGQPIDPELLSEELLCKKELDQGAAYFQLQHMLSTKLTDAMRHPLKTENLVVMRLSPKGKVPLEVVRGFGHSHLKHYQVGNHPFAMSLPHQVSEETAALQGVVMYIDPAGGGANGDETGYAVVGFLNGNVYVLAVGGVPGGYAQPSLQHLADKAKEWAVNTVVIEKNFGYGAFKEVFQPLLFNTHPCAIDEDYVTGNKERRIIDGLEPIMGRGSLIINEDIIESDRTSIERYSMDRRITYSLFFQIAKISRDSGALIHDDRLDALEGAVRFFLAAVAQDQTKAVARSRQREWEQHMQNPQNKRFAVQPMSAGRGVLSRYGL